MKIDHEVEGAASRRLDDVDDHFDGQRQPSCHTASVGSTPSTCATDFPMLTPHEIATLILVAHTPGQVSIEWPDLLPLLSGNLVQIDRCRSCRGKPQVTPLGESLVDRIRQVTQSGIGRHLGR